MFHEVVADGATGVESGAGETQSGETEDGESTDTDEVTAAALLASFETLLSERPRRSAATDSSMRRGSMEVSSTLPLTATPRRFGSKTEPQSSPYRPTATATQSSPRSATTY